MPFGGPLASKVGKELAEWLAGAFEKTAERTAAGELGMPRALERGLAEEVRHFEKTGLPVGVRERAPDIPFPGTARARATARATAEEVPPTPHELGRRVRNFLGGFFDDAPGLTPTLKSAVRDTRVRQAVADVDATNSLVDALAPITGTKEEKFTKFTKLADFMKLADRITTVRGQIAAGVRDPDAAASVTGAALGELEDAFRATARELAGMPDVMQAHTKLRGVLDDVFNDMVDNGYINPDRYRADYIPTQQLEKIMEGLVEARGTSRIGGRELPAMLQRGKNNEITETNLIPLIKDYVADYYRKKAEDNFLLRVMRDEKTNVTRFFRPGDTVPRGFVVYKSGPGLPGWGLKRPEMKFAEGFKDAMLGGGALQRGRYSGVGIVVPEEVGNVLASFRPHRPDPVTAKLFSLGQKWARFMTVYNPRNTALNFPSDLTLALLGMPGERARALGVMRFEPAALRIAFKGMFNKKRELVEIGGHRLDPFEMAMKEGIGGSTLVSDIGGIPIDERLAQYAEAMTMKPWEKVGDFLVRTRQAVELSPRIAAGLEAVARLTGEGRDIGSAISEFGRVGREITLPYGYGAPLHARNPYLRFLTPFMQFTGLATKRVFDLLANKDSRARTVLALTAVPTAAFMWNTQNQNFRKVENALRDFEREQMHIIVPDPMEPSKPLLDKRGNPVVLRFRYFVPEEIARTFGLGNLPSRASRIVRGRETPVKFASESARNVGENLAFQVGPVESGVSFLTGRSSLTGRELGPVERFTNILPQTRAAAETYKAIEAGDPKEIAKTAVEQTLGLTFARVERRGRVLKDADLIEAQRELRRLSVERRTARLNKDSVKAQRLYDQIVAQRRRIAEIRKVLKRESAR